MWRCLSRSVWEAVERQVGLTAFRTNASNAHGQVEQHDPPNRGRISCLVPRLNLGCRARNPQGSQEQAKHEEKEESKQQKPKDDEKWNEPNFHQNVVGAMSWSTALLLSWYIGQPLGLHRLFEEPHKRRRPPQEKKCFRAVSDALIFHAFAQSPVEPLKILPAQASSLGSSSATSNENYRTTSVSSNGDNGSTSTDFDEDFFSTQHGPYTPEEALNEATRLFAAAHQTLTGDVENKLGTRCMERGQHREAVKHFRRAANLENATAAYNLGQCYELGLGTRRNMRKAAKWYTVASDQGHATGMYNLAVFLAHGWGGLTQDKSRAHELLKSASKLGLKKADDALNVIYAFDTPETSRSSVKEVDVSPTNAFLEILGVTENKSVPLPDPRKEDMVALDWLDLSSLSSSPASENVFPSNSHGQYYDGLALEKGWYMPRSFTGTTANYSLCENADPIYNLSESYNRNRDWMGDPTLTFTLYQLAINQQHNASFRQETASKPTFIDLVQNRYIGTSYC